MLFSFSWLCRAAQGHNPSWRGAQERYPRRAAQEHNPSRRGAQGRYPRRAARKGAHTAYIISYFLLKYHCFFTKTRRFFAARPAKRKKHALPPCRIALGRRLEGKPGFAESPREASRHAGGFSPKKSAPAQEKKHAPAQEKKSPPLKKKSRPRSRKKAALAPSEQARPNKSFSPTQKAAPKPFRIWEQPCLFIFLFIRSPAG